MTANNLRNPPVPGIVTADALKNSHVFNCENEMLGTIEHIMLDVRSGRIAYVVLARGGAFGNGENLHAIPWSALALDTLRNCFVLDIDKDLLKASAGFVRNQWPGVPDACTAPSDNRGDGKSSSRRLRAW